jgi:hypothetical protein
MATICANGGAREVWRHSVNRSRAIICTNGRLLVNPGGSDGWHRAKSLTIDDLRADPRWERDETRQARAIVTRTTRLAAANKIPVRGER